MLLRWFFVDYFPDNEECASVLNEGNTTPPRYPVQLVFGRGMGRGHFRVGLYHIAKCLQ